MLLYFIFFYFFIFFNNLFAYTFYTGYSKLYLEHNATNIITEKTSGYNIFLMLSPFESNSLFKKFSYGFSYYNVKGDQNIKYSKVSQILSYYNFTLDWYSKSYPHFYFGYAIGRATYNTNLYFSNSTINSLFLNNNIPLNQESFLPNISVPLKLERIPVSSFIFGSNYIISDVFSIFLEFTINRSVPPDFFKVNPYVELDSYMPDSIVKLSNFYGVDVNKVLIKDFSSKGIKLGVTYILKSK